MPIVPTGIQKLYVSCYRRPADTSGLAYWLRATAAATAAGQADGAVLLSVGNSFGKNLEANAAYASKFAGLSSDGIINKAYLKLFSQAAGPSGLAYWIRNLASRHISLAQIVCGAGESAGTSDDIALARKVTDVFKFVQSGRGTDQIGDFNTVPDTLRACGATSLSDRGHRRRLGPGLVGAKCHRNGPNRRPQFGLGCSGLGLSKNTNWRHNADGRDDEKPRGAQFNRAYLNSALQRNSASITTKPPILSISKRLLNFPVSSVVHSAVGLCLAMGMLLSNVSYAQTAEDIAAARRRAEILQRQEQDRLQHDLEEARRRAERPDGMDTKSLQPKIVVPDIGAPCREIKAITINGAPNLAAAERQRITDEFTGRCLNVGDIERILAEITKNYIDRGFITTRAYLPPQDLSKGHLEILVIEGVVEKIMIDDGNAKSISISNVFPGIEGNALNLRDLEQGIDQINRLSSNNAKLDIQPGEKPGTSTVVVHNQPTFPFHFNIAVDNQGSDSTGKVQTGLTGSMDNILGFNEWFSATHRESTPGDRGGKFSGSDNLSFSIPYGYSTLWLNSSRSRYVSTIRVPSGLELVSTGNSQIDSARLDRVVYRDQSTRASLAATITTKEFNNYLNHQFLGVSSRNLTVFDLDGSLTTGFAGGVLTFYLGYAKGLDALGALHDPDNLPDWAPRAQFTKVKYGFNYSLPFRVFETDASFTSQLTGQKAHDVLYGSERISIGGLYSVRGFVRNSLSGDDGYYCRNEVSLYPPVSVFGEAISTRIYTGYDVGEVSSRDANIPGGRMSGMVVGLSVKWKGAAWDFFSTRPLTRPGAMTKESSQSWFSVSFSF